jgi:hypothetical protein
MTLYHDIRPRRRRHAMAESKATSEVGYGRPPKQTRFKPGQSGNPNGRPSGTRNLDTDLRDELNEVIPVRIGDRSKKVSKQRAMLMALMAKALKGDTRATVVILQMMAKFLPPDEATATGGSVLSADDQEILKRFIDRQTETRGGKP